MTDFSANRKKTDLGVLQLDLDLSEWKDTGGHELLHDVFRSEQVIWLEC